MCCYCQWYGRAKYWQRPCQKCLHFTKGRDSRTINTDRQNQSGDGMVDESLVKGRKNGRDAKWMHLLHPSRRFTRWSLWSCQTRTVRLSCYRINRDQRTITGNFSKATPGIRGLGWLRDEVKNLTGNFRSQKLSLSLSTIMITTMSTIMMKIKRPQIVMTKMIVKMKLIRRTIFQCWRTWRDWTTAWPLLMHVISMQHSIPVTFSAIVSKLTTPMTIVPLFIWWSTKSNLQILSFWTKSIWSNRQTSNESKRKVFKLWLEFFIFGF